MSEYSASSVPKINSATVSTSSSAAEGAQSQAAASRLTQSDAAPVSGYNSAYLQAPAQSASVAVKFVEDPLTKAVTVFVIDRATDKVVRTIPQNEMNNLQPGALLEITA